MNGFADIVEDGLVEVEAEDGATLPSVEEAMKWSFELMIPVR